MYPDPKVASFITENFVPARAHIKEQPRTFERFNAQWTPTIVIADAKGTEQHRIEGFLPAGDFLAQLKLGLAHASRVAGNYDDAERRYRELSQGNDDVAAESLYWAGVSKYKSTNDPSALGETAKTFGERFSDSTWAKKASVWGG